MKLKLALLAAAGSFAMISGAFAQDYQGYYGSLGAGFALDSDDNDFESDSSIPAAFDSEIELDSGVGINAALGRYFSNNWRGELEFATRTQEVQGLPGDGLGFAGFPSDRKMGDVSVSTLMVNVARSFNFDDAGQIHPFIGAGIGAARVRTEIENLTDGRAASTVPEMAVSNLIVMEDTEVVPAMQVRAGMTFDFREDMMISLMFNHLRTAELNQPAYINFPETDVSGELTVNEVMANLRWNWGAPAASEPVPVMTMKPCPGGYEVPANEPCPVVADDPVVMSVDPLTVYFDYDKATLSPLAIEAIDNKVNEVMEGDLAGVMVEGNTDTAGSASYNQALSARRAGVVKDALVARGIDSDMIDVEALGESNPARPTGDGVKEPLNRRTDVTFDFN